MLKGTLQVEIDGVVTMVEEGQMLHVEPGEFHKCSNPTRMTIFSTSSPARHLPQTTNIWKKDDGSGGIFVSQVIHFTLIGNQRCDNINNKISGNAKRLKEMVMANDV